MGGRILIVGATGHIGGRLLRALETARLERPLRCLARRPERVPAGLLSTEVVQGDCLDDASLDRAMAGVDTVYYLVHSLAAGADFAALDRRAAANVGRAAARHGVRRIVYLGGLADGADGVSAHLQSRAETGRWLRAGGVPVVEFRASIVVGAGSLSFEMVRALVERLPLMLWPRWVHTPAQPIAVEDVVAYLVTALDLPPGRGRVFEIGGPDVVSYGDIMRSYARRRGLRRLFISVPVLSPRLSGLWLALVTPAQARVGRALVDGLRVPTVVRSALARETFGVQPQPLDRAIAQAIADGGPAWSKTDTRSLDVDVAPAVAFAPIRRIGGASGWYFGTLLWRIRGWMDRAVGGVGMGRGRRDCEGCRVGDVIDGWRVEAYEPDRRLRLAADLKLPGRGWLEFEVTPLDAGRSRIRQTATFDPVGLLGRAYWYATVPLHAVIFAGLLREIGRRAERLRSAGARRPPAMAT